MIVYFSEKSKKDIIRYAVWAVFGVLILYMNFVFVKSLRRDLTTLQIIQNSGYFLYENTQKSTQIDTGGRGEDLPFVASKKGKYYYPSNCSKAKALSIKNTLYFKDKISAEGSGYMPYLGCF